MMKRFLHIRLYFFCCVIASSAIFPAGKKTKSILLAVPTPKGVFLRWSVPAALNSNHFLVYRKRSDNNTWRKITLNELHRAKDEKSFREVLGADLRKMATGNARKPIENETNPEEIGRPKLHIPEESEIKQREKDIIENFLLDSPAMHFASYFYPSLAKALGLYYFDEDVIFPAQYTYSLRTVTGGAEKEIANAKVDTGKIPQVVSPKTPKGEPAHRKNTIFWEPQKKDQNVLGYNLYRNENESGDFKKLNDLPIVLGSGGTTPKGYKAMVHYDDYEVENGKDYWYYVTAVHFAGIESNPSKKLKMRPIDNRPPPAPEMVKTEVTSLGKIHVRWQLSPDPAVVYYDIYRANKQDGKYEKINKSPLPNNMNYFEDDVRKIDQENWYRVKAVNKRNIESGFSIALPALTVRKTKPPLPTGVKTKPGHKYIDISWDKVKDEFVTKYEVLRSESNNGDYIILGKASLKKPIFRDSKVEPGIDYWYSVRAVDKFEKRSPDAEPAMARMKGLVQNLFPPSSITALSGPGKVLISWKPILVKNSATGYHVYRKKLGEVVFTRITEKSLGLNEWEYSDALANPQGIYEYIVRPVDKEGKVGKASEIARAEFSASSPETIQDLYAVTMTNHRKKKVVRIYWPRIPDNVKSVNIYRTDPGKQGEKKLNDKPVAVQSKFYDDSTAKPEIYYTYFIRPIQPNGTPGEKSGAVYYKIR